VSAGCDRLIIVLGLPANHKCKLAGGKRSLPIPPSSATAAEEQGSIDSLPGHAMDEKQIEAIEGDPSFQNTGDLSADKNCRFSR
jgi:hypothetical protein